MPQSAQDWLSGGTTTQSRPAGNVQSATNWLDSQPKAPPKRPSLFQRIGTALNPANITQTLAKKVPNAGFQAGLQRTSLTKALIRPEGGPTFRIKVGEGMDPKSYQSIFHPPEKIVRKPAGNQISPNDPLTTLKDLIGSQLRNKPFGDPSNNDLYVAQQALAQSINDPSLSQSQRDALASKFNRTLISASMGAAIAQGLGSGMKSVSSMAEVLPRTVLRSNARKILGVDDGATLEEIKTAYRTAAHNSHPDLGGTPEQFHRIQTAYDYLTNPGAKVDLNVLGSTTSATTQPQAPQLASGKIPGVQMDVNSVPSSIEGAPDQIKASTLDQAKLYKDIIATDPKQASAIYQPNGELTKQTATHMVNDTVGTLDGPYPGQGLGQKFINSVNLEHATPESIYKAGMDALALAKAPTSPTPFTLPPYGAPAAPARVIPPLGGAMVPKPSAIQQVRPTAALSPTPTAPTIQPTVNPQQPTTPQFPGQNMAPRVQPLVGQASQAPVSAPQPQAAPQPAPSVPAPIQAPAAPPQAPMAPVAPAKPRIDITKAVVSPDNVDNFFVLNNQGEFTPISGKQVDIVPHFDTFVHRALGTPGFAVSEGKTGMQVATGPTMPKAIASATELLINNNLRVDNALQVSVDNNGLSPRYTLNPVVTTPAGRIPLAQGLSPEHVQELAKMGVSPAAIATARPAPIASDYTPAPAKAAPKKVVKPRISLAEKVKAEITKEAGVPSAVDFVRKHGGFSMEKETALKGELRRFTNKESGTAGLVKSTGKTVDGMFELMKEDGLFPRMESLNDMLDAIDNELSKEMPAFKYKGTVKSIKPGVVTIEKNVAPSSRAFGPPHFRETIARNEGLGKLNEKEARMVTSIINSIAPSGHLDDASIKFFQKYSPEFMGGQHPEKVKAGLFDPRRIVNIAIREARGEKGGVPRTVAHEVTHTVWNNLSEKTQQEAKAQFEQQKDKWLKSLSPVARDTFKSGEFVPSNYKWRNTQEYLAEAGADKEYSKAQYQEAMEHGTLLDKLKALINKFFNAIRTAFKQVMGDKFEKALVEWKKNPEVAPQTATAKDLALPALEASTTPREIKPGELTVDPAPRDLFNKDHEVERDVYQNGFDPAKHEVIVRLENGKYKILVGQPVLRAIQRLSAKGLPSPATIPISVVDLPAPDAQERSRTMLSDQQIDKMDVPQAEKDNMKKLQESIDPLAAMMMKDVELTNGVIVRVSQKMGFLKKANLVTKYFVKQSVLGHIVQPSIYHKDVFPVAYWGTLQRDHFTSKFDRVLSKLSKGMSKKNGILMERWMIRRQLPLSTEVKGYSPALKESDVPQWIKDRAAAITRTFTDPMHALLVEKKYLSPNQYQKDYLPFGPQKGTPVDSSGNVAMDLTSDPSFLHVRGKQPIFDTTMDIFSKLRRYSHNVADKVYLEPTLESLKQHTEDQLSKGEIDQFRYKSRQRWIEYTRNPYQIKTTVVNKMMVGAYRKVMTLATQAFSQADLGLRTVFKNVFSWGVSMTAKETGIHSFRAFREMTTRDGQAWADKYAPNIIDSALPQIYGTLGMSPEGIIKAVQKVERFTPTAMGQIIGEKFLRNHAIQAGKLQAQTGYREDGVKIAQKLLGLDNEEAIALQAHMTVVRSQQIYSPIDLPPLYRAAISRPFGQFILPSSKQFYANMDNVAGLKGANKALNARKLAWFLASSMILGFLISSLWPKKNLITTTGKEYQSGGIDPWEGIDSFDLRKIPLAIPLGTTTALGMVVQRVTVSPVVALLLHGVGVSLPTDKIYNARKTPDEIFIKDLPVSVQKQAINDVMNIMEIQGWKAADPTDTKYLNSAAALGDLLDQFSNDPTKSAELKKKYASLVPLVSDAQSAVSDLRSLAATHSSDKSDINDDDSLSKDEKKQSIKELDTQYIQDRKQLIGDFNKQLQQQISGQTSDSGNSVFSFLGVNTAMAAGITPSGSVNPTGQVTSTEKQALSTPNAQSPLFKTSGTDAVARSFAALEGNNKPGSIAQRQNNPGNLVYAGQPGAHKAARNQFAVFPTKYLGWIALKKQIISDAKKGKTIEDFIYKYVKDSTAPRRLAQFNAQFKSTPRTKLINIIQ